MKYQFIQLHLLKFLYTLDHYHQRYMKKQKWVFFIETHCMNLGTKLMNSKFTMI